MKTQRRSRFTHPHQALSAEFSIIVWFAAVIAQGENTKTKPIHAPSSGFPVSEFGIIIWFADVRAQANLSLVEICSIKYVQVQVHESQNGAVVLNGGVAAIAICHHCLRKDSLRLTSRLWKRLFWFMEGTFLCCDW